MLSDPAFAGRLTASEYRRWFRHACAVGQAASSFGFLAIHEYRIERDFALYRKSEFMLENFFNLDEAFRLALKVFASDDFSLAAIETFARLALEVQSLELGLAFDSKTSVVEIGFGLYAVLSRELGKSGIKEFHILLHDYIVADDRDERRPFVENLVMMLAIVKGPSIVIEVLERWLKGSCPAEPEDFVAVVQDWENLKIYPIEWAANVVRSS